MSSNNVTPEEKVAAETAAAAAPNVQAEAAVDNPIDKVVEAESDKVDEQQPAGTVDNNDQEQQPEQTTDAAPVAESADDKTAEQAGDEADKAQDDNVKVVEAEKQPAGEQEQGAEKTTEGVKDEQTKEQVDQPVAGETNGVAKRKADSNGAEAQVDDEKSPKKAKVVDEADQKPVEETAA